MENKLSRLNMATNSLNKTAYNIFKNKPKDANLKAHLKAFKEEAKKKSL